MDLSYLESLNAEQRRAVQFGVTGEGANLCGPLLVIAGAGSGKTTTLAHRVGHLVINGVDPQRIMLLTFSRRSAQEMTRRSQCIMARALKLETTGTFQWAGTFHAVGARFIREYASRIGLDPSFTILDREDSADLLNLVRHDLDLMPTNKRFPQKGTCLGIYSRTINSEMSLSDVLEQHFPWCLQWIGELQRLFAAYVREKQKRGTLDYDDLLLYWSGMTAVPEIAAEIGARFDHILVDEFQDTNHLQSSILTNLRPTGTGLMVVGDDAQAIYGFRAATIRNILDFPGQFSPAAQIVTLAQNYRSTRPVLAASNAIIGFAKERFTKHLWSNRESEQRPYLVTVQEDLEQARYVATKVLECRESGTLLKHQAVLFRASSHSSSLEIELTRRNIPFVKFGGLRFLDTSHVKDVIAVLRFVENPRDRVAAFRVLQLLPGIGPKIAGKALEFISGHAAPLEKLSEIAPPSAAAVDWPRMVELVRQMKHGSIWPADVEAVREWHAAYLESQFDDAAVRLADLAQLQQIANGYSSRESFLTELALDPPSATSDEAGGSLLEEDHLILSTIHSAKGQEWKNVFVLNVIDGCIPSDLGAGSCDDLEEERRLLYVATTRAKDDLHLIVPHRWYVHRQISYGDRHVYASRSRFIPAEILKLFDVISWSSSRIGPSITAKVAPKIDLAAAVQARWLQ